MRLSMGNKNFRVSFGGNRIGYSVGVKGMRVSHRAGSNTGLKWIFIGPFVLVYYIIKYMFALVYYTIKYMIIGTIKLTKFIIKKIKAKAEADAPDIEEAQEIIENDE